MKQPYTEQTNPVSYGIACRINAVSLYYSTHGLQNMESDMIGIHKQEFEVFVSQKYLQKKANDSIAMTTAEDRWGKPVSAEKGEKAGQDIYPLGETKKISTNELSCSWHLLR